MRLTSHKKTWTYVKHKRMQPEVYLRRKIDAFWDAWKAEPKHKPLIFRGAGQVGKTEAITQFAPRQYKHVVYVNFVESPYCSSPSPISALSC